MTNCMHTSFATAALAFLVTFPAAAQHSGMPAGMTHEEHQAQMKKDAELKRRGAAAMGFDQDATTHHFRLREDGGAIEVDARAAGNPSVRDAVRSHLREIAQSFADGDFAKPFATHGEVPPGVAEMTRLKASISYLFEETEHGGRVRIRTSTTAARDAVHAFLRYQIREHATGDPLTVKVPS